MTQINWTARVTNLAQRTRNSYNYQCFTCGKQDPGHVAPGVLPALAAFAAQIGYPVQLRSEEWFGNTPSASVLGTTAHPGNERGLPQGIYLLEGMSPASTARVLGHELNHAMDGPTPVTIEQILFGAAEDTGEEVTAELATGAFTEAEEIGTGQFAHHYLGQRLRGYMPPSRVIEQAARNAQRLYEAVHNAG